MWIPSHHATSSAHTSDHLGEGMFPGFQKTTPPGIATMGLINKSLKLQTILCLAAQIDAE